MKRFRLPLFWRINGIFWLGLFCTVLTNQWFTEQILERELGLSEVRKHQESLASTALTIYEANGPAALTHWLMRLKARHDIRAFLLNERFETLHLQPAPPPLVAMLQTRRFGPPWLRPVKLTAESGETLLFIAHIPFDPKLQVNPHVLKVGRLLITITVLGLFAFLLARSLKRPLVAIQQSAQRLSDGHLDARVDAPAVKRGDELGDLARSFNHMGERLSALVNRQQQFLRDVSHEIRSPLTRQTLALALLRRQGAATELLDRVEQENQYIDHLVDELITLVRLGQTDQHLRLARVDLVQLVVDVVTQCQLEADAKPVRIHANLPDEAEVEIEAPLISRAIANLLSNAIKYSPADTDISITLTVDAKSLRLDIGDAGPGIEPDKLEQVLEPFYREDQARQATGGYGLGLAIARQAVVRHGGTLKLHNRDQGGLLARIELPR